MIIYNTFSGKIVEGKFNGRECYEMTSRNGIGGLYFPLEQTSGHAAKIIAFIEKFEKIQKMRQGSQIDVDNQQEL